MPNNYPVHVFPDELRNVINTLHEDAQMPIEMIGGTVLAALSLALQPLINVASPYDDGKTEPCSLYFLTLAKSGEGKSPLREMIMAPFDKFTADMHSEYQEKYEQYRKESKLWSIKEKTFQKNIQKALNNRGESAHEDALFLEHQKVEPVKPKEFILFYEDATPEGIIEGLKAYPYAGIFSDEAITFFTGRLKNNLGLLNKIWKNEPISLSRKKDGHFRIDAHLTFLLMVQPTIFEEYLDKQGKNALFSGFLPRFLFTNTTSTTHSRRVHLNQENSKRALEVLFRHFDDYLQEQKKHFEDGSLLKKTLVLSDGAKHIYQDKVNRYQSNTLNNQPWEHISEFVSKAGSQAIRIAAMLAYYSKEEMTDKYLNAAFALTEWHLNQTSKYFYRFSRQYQLQQDVYLLFDWLKNRFLNPVHTHQVHNSATGNIENVKFQQWEPFPKSDIEQNGPYKLRKAQRLNDVLAQLIGLELIAEMKYQFTNTVYLSALTTDTFGNIKPRNPVIINYYIIKSKVNVTPPLRGYDITKLQWG